MRHVPDALNLLCNITRAHCARAEFSIGGAWPLQPMVVSGTLWDGARTEEARAELRQRIVAVAKKIRVALGANELDLRLYFQSEARDPSTSEARLRAIAGLFPRDVAGNPAVQLAAIADPMGWGFLAEICRR